MSTQWWVPLPSSHWSIFYDIINNDVIYVLCVLERGELWLAVAIGSRIWLLWHRKTTLSGKWYRAPLIIKIVTLLTDPGYIFAPITCLFSLEVMWLGLIPILDWLHSMSLHVEDERMWCCTFCSSLSLHIGIRTERERWGGRKEGGILTVGPGRELHHWS